MRGPQPNAPRTIDVDLLLYGHEVRALPSLTLPASRGCTSGASCSCPLAEIAPEARASRAGPERRASSCERCPDPSAVTPLAPRGTGAA